MTILTQARKLLCRLGYHRYVEFVAAEGRFANFVAHRCERCGVIPFEEQHVVAMARSLERIRALRR